MTTHLSNSHPRSWPAERDVICGMILICLISIIGLGAVTAVLTYRLSKVEAAYEREGFAARDDQQDRQADR